MAKGDIKSQLGSFVRGALAQLDSVREVVVQKSKAGRIQLDVAMMKRRRKELLAELGSTVARLALNGRITEEEFPELGPALAQLEAMEERITIEEDRARRVAAGEEEAGEGYGPAEDYDENEDDEEAAAEAALAAEEEAVQAAEAEAEAAEEAAEDLDSGSKRG